jgi:hypothetical protein
VYLQEHRVSVDRRVGKCNERLSRRYVIESYEGARYSKGLRGADGKGKGGGGVVAECRIGCLVSQYSHMSKTSGAEEAESRVGSSEADVPQAERAAWGACRLVHLKEAAAPSRAGRLRAWGGCRLIHRE